MVGAPHGEQRRARRPPEARGGRARATWLRDDFADRTRGRTATLNQLLLASVVFALGTLVAVGPFPGDAVLFFVGVVVIVVVTGATLVVPWNRLAYGWVAVVPAIDIIAITLLQLAAPGSAMGLLWIFPTTWLASGFGLLGLFAVIVAIAGITSVLAVVSAQQVTYTTFLLPLVLFAVAATSHLTARRSDAQRTLLAKQAQLLHGVLDSSRRQEQVVTEVLDAVDFGLVRIDGSGRIAVTNEAHGRLQQALGGEDGEQPPAFRDDGVTRLPPDELPVERALRGEAFSGQIVWFGEDPGPRKALSVTARRLIDPRRRRRGSRRDLARRDERTRGAARARRTGRVGVARAAHVP